MADEVLWAWAVAEAYSDMGMGSVDLVEAEVSDGEFLYHSDWGDDKKVEVSMLEAAALTGLNPRDIRPVVRDQESGDDMLVDSGSVICLEPAKPGLRANGVPDPSIRLTTAKENPWFATER